MSKKWMVVHAHYRGEPPKRSDFDADFVEKDKVYRCPKCKKVIAGIEAGRRNRLYVLAKDVVVDVESSTRSHHPLNLINLTKISAQTPLLSQ